MSARKRILPEDGGEDNQSGLGRYVEPVYVEPVDREYSLRTRILNGAKLGGLVLAAVLGLNSCYVVDQTEHAVVTRFGKQISVVLNPVRREGDESKIVELEESYANEGITSSRGPGLHFKLPWDAANKFDRRVLRWNGFPEQISTRDKTNIWVDATARWSIGDPVKYMNAGGTEEQAHARLDNLVDSEVRTKISARPLVEIVGTDNRELLFTEEELRKSTKVEKVMNGGRNKLVEDITYSSQGPLIPYGIDLHDKGVMIKGVNYVESVKDSVERRMAAERLSVAQRYTSEGEGDFNDVMGRKDLAVAGFTTDADRRSGIIRGLADAQATRIYAEGFTEIDEKTKQPVTYTGFGADPAFYNYWRTLGLYSTSFEKGNTRLVIGTDNPLFGLLKGKSLNDVYEESQKAQAAYKLAHPATQSP